MENAGFKKNIGSFQLKCIPSAIAAGLLPERKLRFIQALSLGAVIAVSTPLSAAMFTVMTDADSGPGSLRDAITLANANPDVDEITFDGSVSGSILLTGGALETTNPLTISGPGESVLSVVGDGNTSVFVNQSTLTISGVTITGGQRNSGGGIFNTGNLTVSNSTITGNDASSGGGIYNNPGNATTTLEITNTTIDDNEAFSGGGIYSNNTGAGTANIIINSSAISGNTAQSQGGGIFNGAKNNNDAQAIVTINNSTISGNTANNTSLRDGGGIYNYASNGGTANVTVNNSTVSGNMANSAGGVGSYSFYGTTNITIKNSTITGNTTTDTSANHGAIYVGQWYADSVANVTISNSIIAAQLNGDDCWGFFVSNGYNLDSDGTCTFNHPSDLPNTNMPFLGPLMNNGGPTNTHALLAGSPAIDAIPVGVNDCGTDPIVDQRGESRLQDGDNDVTAKCDIGAYEQAGFTLGTGTLGDFVWEDLNGNGIQNNNEPGLEGITVELQNCSGTVLDTRTTGPLGKFSFANLAAGDYQMQYVLPAGYHFSPTNQGGNFRFDSNANTITGLAPCLNVMDGQLRLALDAGMVLDNPTGAGVIGDFVWEDLNGNGIQDNTEPGLAGVMIDLLDCNAGDAVVASTVSAANGSYVFNTVAVGNFRVRFNPVPGFSYSPTGQGSWFNNSDAGAGGKSSCRSMAAGQVRNGIDAGYVPDGNGGGGTGQTGDFVWDDLNENGIQDNTEPGLANVMVDLYSCDGPNLYLDTKMTDVNGDFLFTGLGVGKFRARFTTLPGYQFSTPGQGGNFRKDSNVNVNTGFGPCLMYSAGQVRRALDAGMHQ